MCTMHVHVVHVVHVEEGMRRLEAIVWRTSTFCRCVMQAEARHGSVDGMDGACLAACSFTAQLIEPIEVVWSKCGKPATATVVVAGAHKPPLPTLGVVPRSRHGHGCMSHPRRFGVRVGCGSVGRRSVPWSVRAHSRV